MKSGDTVFIQAGASGLGIAAIQLAKAFGAKVIATVGSDKKAEAVRRLGADIVVNRKTDNLGRILEENPVDIVLDCVGGTGLGKHLEKLAPGRTLDSDCNTRRGICGNRPAPDPENAGSA